MSKIITKTNNVVYSTDLYKQLTKIAHNYLRKIVEIKQYNKTKENDLLSHCIKHLNRKEAAKMFYFEYLKVTNQLN